MAAFVTIETDLTEVMEAFDQLQERSPRIQRNILAGIGSRAASIAKRNYSLELHKRTGNLYKNLKRVLTRRGDAVIIYSNAQSENRVRYGFVLAKGTTIKAQQDYLTFKIGDKWLKRKSVTLPARDWLVKPVEHYIGSTEYDAQIEKLLQKEVDKLFKKGVLK